MRQLVHGCGDARQPGATYAPEGEHAAAPHAARVLIVEDEHLVSLEIEYHLTAAGFTVVGIAATAVEALEIAGLEKPALAIVDVLLAEESDGVEAAIALNTRFGIRSIFTTAHADAEIRRRGEAANPLGWLEKPYESQTLIALVNKALRTGSSR
jgi:two-component system, response regulator PdtaR